MDNHLITRQIEIDMGHRVTYHASKCRNIHGHRYRIHAHCRGPLAGEGSSEGMVIDFGFLKEEMMKEIHKPCDHALCLWWQDPFIRAFFQDDTWKEIESKMKKGIFSLDPRKGDKLATQIYITEFVPTAENLARHWFERLRYRVVERSDKRASLIRVDVWETPNCRASYPGGI